MKIVREQREENNSLLRVTVGEEDYGQAVEKELREYKRKANIPGFRPGKPTSDFITRTLNKITLIGAIFLAVVAVLPIVLGNLTGMSIQLGGTSLLIVVGVALDTTRSLDSFMTMRSHKGFLG